ncbi:MAG: dTDP-4-dehydrorhamnose reductase [Chlamydiota bacterium]
MKVWVLGASGMLGSSIVELLKKRNISFVATGREVDITSYSSLETFFLQHTPTHLINCAAYTQVDLAEKEQELSFALNVLGVENLGSIGQNFGVKILHFSTDYVFSGNKLSPYTEEDVCDPVSIYGKTKYEGERRLLQKTPDVVIVRTSWLFGFRKINFIEKILQKMKEEKEVYVVDDQIGRPTFCDDLADIAISLLPYRGLFHFANSQQTSWHQFAEGIFELASQRGDKLICEKITKTQTAKFPTLAKRPMYSVLDTKKVENFLQIHPRNWKEALQDYFKRSEK